MTRKPVLDHRRFSPEILISTSRCTVLSFISQIVRRQFVEQQPQKWGFPHYATFSKCRIVNILCALQLRYPECLAFKLRQYYYHTNTINTLLLSSLSTYVIIALLWKEIGAVFNLSRKNKQTHESTKLHIRKCGRGERWCLEQLLNEDENSISTLPV